ncbi:Protein FAR1-RELATED SEQUENCE 5 [Cardamine amara subsp. amara]|uniref:Protein FAR1-RELATED SEQUENCE 5 n=1 Tax=Cardamine amara subsp. amara TaxID=228776 RepID=A0ABD0Z6M3_CARAN
MDFTYFGDTVTTYRSNRYRLPFAPFTGVNHHGQAILFGCAFIINETEASFVWLFNTWLTAMSSHPPLSITTDHDAKSSVIFDDYGLHAYAHTVQYNTLRHKASNFVQEAGKSLYTCKPSPRMKWTRRLIS